MVLAQELREHWHGEVELPCRAAASVSRNYSRRAVAPILAAAICGELIDADAQEAVASAYSIRAAAAAVAFGTSVWSIVIAGDELRREGALWQSIKRARNRRSSS